MIERRIKELAIALEAISRVNTYSAVNVADDITNLLKTAIKEAKEQHKERNEAPKHIDNDDIPF